MCKIDFIYIGPDKSGSTWLYNIFRQHPEIYVPVAKDIYFFDRYYYKGFKWYKSFFKGSSNFKVSGEISHDYMFDFDAMCRIKRDLPNVKLFTILRNPFEKIWSQYLFLIRSGITNKPFEKAIESIDELIDKCLYGKYLSRYINMFDQEQLIIFYFDDLKKEPKKFAKEIFNFLGVNMVDDINYYEKFLPASKPRSFYVAKLAKKSAVFLRELGFVNFLGQIKSNRIIQKILYVPYDKSAKPKMTKKQFDIIYPILKKDIELLQEITNKSFKHWLIYK